MSDTGHHAGKPPKYDGKGGRSFDIWVMKKKAWLYNIGCGAVLISGFDGTLSVTKRAVLNPTVVAEKAQHVALNQKYKAVNGCILSFETPEMMNKVMEEQAHDPDCPGGKFTRIWTRIKEDEKPDDTMAKFELDEDLRKIMLSRKNQVLNRISDTGYHAGKPPKYDGKGGQSFKMWVIKYKAWMHNIGIGAALSPGFE